MKKIATAAVLVLAMMMASMVGIPAEADAKKPAPEGIACLKSGQATLRSLGLFDDAARGEIDYSALADAEAGPIFADLPEGSFLPINTVFALHKSNPELFAWCN